MFSSSSSSWLPVFDVVPPANSVLPQWSFDDITVDAASTSQMLEQFTLPAAAAASGIVTDANGPLSGASVQVYVKALADTAWKLRSTTNADDSGALTIIGVTRDLAPLRVEGSDNPPVWTNQTPQPSRTFLSVRFATPAI